MIGEIVKHYKIFEQIGQGGMSTIYKAGDIESNRIVVLKFLAAPLSQDSDSRKRFLLEGQSLAALKHENICTTYELAEAENGQLFLVMEYYEGETLKDKLKIGSLELPQVVEYVTKIANGLAEAHKHGIIHRDIKPANIMITNAGEVKILDFGLAKFLGGTKLTKTGMHLGTPNYMSPEQVQGKKIDHRTDIWSLGILTYEMLAGSLPFNGENDQALMYSIIHEQPELFFENRNDISDKIKRAIKKSLEKDPDKRYQSAIEFVNDLRTDNTEPESSHETVVAGLKSLIGTTVDNYKILKEIGRGGMGVVYKGIDLNLEKEVAIKVMHPGFQLDDSIAKHFREEAKALARLESTHIVHIYALRFTKQGTFIVMEYVDGTNLDKLLRENGPIPWQKAVGYCRQLLRALNHAHKARVVHRDIKPSNVLITNKGMVKLTDFGLAKIKKQDSNLTRTRFSAGTLYYMSPEQVRDPGVVDIRSDIYAMGMTFYEMIIGDVPFSNSTSEFNVQKAILENAFPMPSKINPEIPEKLSAIIAKCIEKKPENRYQNVLEILNDMDHLTEKKERDSGTSRSYLEKKIKLILIAAVSIAVILSGYYIYNKYWYEKEPIIKSTPIIKKEFATLNITSEPDQAHVFINNIQSGITPCKFDSLAEMTYEIKVMKQGYKTWQNPNYYISAGSDNPLHIVLTRETPVYKKPKKVIKNAELSLNVIPEGLILIEDKMIDEKEKQSLAPGTYNLQFKHPVFGTMDTTIILNGGENIELTCYFQQIVNINAYPVGSNTNEIFALININGILQNDLWTPKELTLLPGKYSISLSKIGYQSVEKEIRLEIKPSFKKITKHITFHLKEKN